MVAARERATDPSKASEECASAQNGVGASTYVCTPDRCGRERS